MYNILRNWRELKSYFTCVEMATEKMDSKYKAQLLKEMLSDDTNYLYFVFTTPVVNEIGRVNGPFARHG